MFMKKIYEKYLRKKIGIIIILLLLILGIVLIRILIINNKITDIVKEENVVKFNVDRKFYMNENEKKDVSVTIEGIGDFKTKDFEGEIIVDGFEIEADAIGYDFQVLGEDFGDNRGDYLLSCIGVKYKDENKQYAYDINISKDFKKIEIIITNWATGETFFAINEGENDD